MNKDVIHEALQELKLVEKQEELLEEIDSANKKFLQNSFGPLNIKVYKNGQIPYELSNKYMEEHDE